MTAEQALQHPFFKGEHDSLKLPGIRPANHFATKGDDVSNRHHDGRKWKNYILYYLYHILKFVEKKLCVLIGWLVDWLVCWLVVLYEDYNNFFYYVHIHIYKVITTFLHPTILNRVSLAWFYVSVFVPRFCFCFW